MGRTDTRRGARQAGPPPARDEGPRVRAYLFDADGEDREVRLEEALADGLSSRQLLWVDVSGRDAGELERVVGLLSLDRRATGAPEEPPTHPQVKNYGDTFGVDVRGVREEGERLRGVPLKLVVGPRALVTVHPEPIAFLEEFTRQERSNDKPGQLTPEAFLATLLGWHLTSYLREVEALEGELDRLDEAILRRPADGDFLEDLVRQRRRVGELRRLLTDHREVYATLARPDFKALAEGESADEFAALEDRFERAVTSTEGLREAVLGSFDLYMTSLGRRTNDTMRVLTVATVLMGLWALVAALLSMNFELPFEKTGLQGFLVVVAALLLLSAGVMWAARRRRWW